MIEARYIDTAEVAKIIRKGLKALHPETKFSVKTHRYAGGSSIDINWTDGPQQSVIDAFGKKFTAGSFDGMTDSYDFITSELGGEQVRFGAHYVFAHRDVSDIDTKREMSLEYIRAHCAIETDAYGNERFGVEWLGDLAERMARRWDSEESVPVIFERVIINRR